MEMFRDHDDNEEVSYIDNSRPAQSYATTCALLAALSMIACSPKDAEDIIIPPSSTDDDSSDHDNNTTDDDDNDDTNHNLHNCTADFAEITEETSSDVQTYGELRFLDSEANATNQYANFPSYVINPDESELTGMNLEAPTLLMMESAPGGNHTRFSITKTGGDCIVTVYFAGTSPSVSYNRESAAEILGQNFTQLPQLEQFSADGQYTVINRDVTASIGEQFIIEPRHFN